MTTPQKKPRKPYTLSPAAIEARRKAAEKSIPMAVASSAKNRRGKKAAGGVLSTEMTTQKLAPQTLSEADKRRLPGEPRHMFFHRATMAMPLPRKNTTQKNPSSGR